MAWFTGFPVNAVKSTSARLEYLCKIEWKNMSETSDLPVPRSPPFQTTLTKKTSSMQSKRRDLHYKWPHRETNENTLLLLYFTTMNNSNIFYDNKRVHISPLFCTLIFCPKHLFTMCSNCQNFHNCSVFKYSAVPAFHHSGIPCLSTSPKKWNLAFDLPTFKMFTQEDKWCRLVWRCWSFIVMNHRAAYWHDPQIHHPLWDGNFEFELILLQLWSKFSS